MKTGGNAVLSGQQKQQNVPAGRVIKVVAARLSLVQISERCRLTWHEHDQWKIIPPSWPVSSVRKAVGRTELSLSLSLVYFG